MKTQRSKKAMTLAVLIFDLVLTAAMTGRYATADDIYLGEPGYGGTGCPAGSVSVTLSPDHKYLRMVTDQFVVRPDPHHGRTTDRKNCQLTIPVHVPEGLSVALVNVNAGGYLSLPAGARARLNLQSFITGIAGRKSVSKNFRGPMETEYLTQISVGDESWSPCGQDINIRVAISALVVNNSLSSDAMMTVEFPESGFMQLIWKACKSTNL